MITYFNQFGANPVVTSKSSRVVNGNTVITETVETTLTPTQAQEKIQVFTTNKVPFTELGYADAAKDCQDNIDLLTTPTNVAPVQVN